MLHGTSFHQPKDWRRTKRPLFGACENVTLSPLGLSVQRTCKSNMHSNPLFVTKRVFLLDFEARFFDGMKKTNYYPVL